MTRTLFTTIAAATLLAGSAFAEPAPDIPDRTPEAPDTEQCDSADFANKGQWAKCLTQSGVHGKELAQRIHDEHQTRKGGETTERSKGHAKKAAKNADRKARKAKAKKRAKDMAKEHGKDEAKRRAKEKAQKRRGKKGR